jgi:hypothetical protein
MLRWYLEQGDEEEEEEKGEEDGQRSRATCGRKMFCSALPSARVPARLDQDQLLQV